MQLSFLKSRGYKTISSDDLYNFLKNGKDLPFKPIILTFDDGRENVFRNGIPLLKKYGFTAVFFIYPSVISIGDSRFLTVDQLKKMKKDGFDIQSHTWSHQNFEAHRNLPKEKYLNFIRKEFLRSKEWLERNLNSKVEYLAYPYGYYNNDMDELAISSGYKLIFTTNQGVNTKNVSLSKIKRQDILRRDTLQDFIDKVQAGILEIKENYPSESAETEFDTVPISAILADISNINTGTLKFYIDLKGRDTFFENGTKKVYVNMAKLRRGFHSVLLKARDKNNRLLEASWVFIKK